ncbi:MAG: ParB/RepB/Spo0J family partition protein [Lachnospiraceae bacterium]|nr:ParB/RepB/Spo0J family partition protein [Lachnospiraceae bacterium]
MTGFDMKSLDELFGIQDADSSFDFEEIPLSQIDSFPNHPFKVVDNDDMQQLADSVKENGVINPAIVRFKSDGRYELISGHRRKRACELAGLTTLKCAVMEISDDEATVYMVDSNFQRSKVLPSEKAFAYKMRLEAMKKRSGRPIKNSDPLGPNFVGERSNQKLASEVRESATQIKRYIRLI